MLLIVATLQNILHRVFRFQLRFLLDSAVDLGLCPQSLMGVQALPNP